MEYGSASVELQTNAFEFCEKTNGKTRALVVDDLMATGGTMKAACDVINAHAEAKVIQTFVLMELAFLNGKSKLSKDIDYKALIVYN